MIDYLEFTTNNFYTVVFKNVPKIFYIGMLKKFNSNFFNKKKSNTPVILTIDFKDKLLERNKLKMVGRKFVFDESGYYLVENDALAKIEFDKIFDDNFTIRLEYNFDPIRFMGYILEPLMRVILLNKGFLSVHSSSCYVNNKMFVFSAWGNVGKTNLILAMKNNGATIFGDDWTTITPCGKALIDIRPINLLFYNLEIFPEYKNMISWKKKFFLKIDSIIRDKPTQVKKKNSLMLRLYDLSLKLTETLSNAQIPLEALQENTIKEHKITSLYLMIKYKENGIGLIDNIDIFQIAKKSAICFIHENMSLFNHINEYIYASNGDYGAFIKNIEELYIKTFSDIFSSQYNISKGMISLPEIPNRQKLEDFAKTLIGK